MAREQPLAGAPSVSMTAIPSLAAERRASLSRHFHRQVIPRILLILVCALFLLPFYWMVNTALKSTSDLVAYPPLLWPTELTWANFRDAVEFIPFPVLIVALFDIFAKTPRPVLDGWQLAWEGNWINTYLPLVVPMFFGNAFWIFLMRQFMMQIPHEISDAARIDGASEFRIFYQIVLPQALPAIGVISIFAGLHAWNDFIGPLIFLLDDTKYTLALGLTFFQSQRELQFSLLMAASTLVVLPVVALFLLFQRAFVEGISLGSIK